MVVWSENSVGVSLAEFKTFKARIAHKWGRMLALQLRPRHLPSPSGSFIAPSAAEIPVPPQPDVRPLLVLDAGEFLTRCRRCDWKCPHVSTAGAAWAAFEAHLCKERPA
jgi:hypothetical protein